MFNYLTADQATLKQEYSEVKEFYAKLCAKNLKLDMSRGKPGAKQLDLTEGMLTILKNGQDCFAENGFDCRNYGILGGIPEAKAMFAALLGVSESQMLILGNSSLNIMYDTLASAALFGVGGYEPWSKQGKIRFLCPVPGYDRHFTLCEAFGIEMIPVAMKADGPDMDQVEKLVSSDPTIKGIWCVPKYANPTGITYSDEVVNRFAQMKTAAPDFRIFWDNAYFMHDLEETTEPLADLLSASAACGYPDRVFMFASTSKVTFPGAGIAIFASSEANIAEMQKHLTAQTIGHDKLNQLRHVKFFGTADGVRAHMQKHAAILRPKFDCVIQAFTKELAPRGIASFHNPRGGYFISLDVLDHTARRTWQLAKEAGVTLTSVGATFPYGKDPDDRNLRIAPTYPSDSDLKAAVEVLCCCARLAALEKLVQA